jgi:uncharacterized protein (TIGR02996 family)
VTDEEALALKPGQRVEALVGRHHHYLGRHEEWRPAVVRGCWRKRNRGVAVAVTLEGWHVRHPYRQLGPGKVRDPRDPLPANVYADFLDERGEYRAAALLRGAFPLGPPGG